MSRLRTGRTLAALALAGALAWCANLGAAPPAAAPAPATPAPGTPAPATAASAASAPATAASGTPAAAPSPASGDPAMPSPVPAADGTPPPAVIDAREAALLARQAAGTLGADYIRLGDDAAPILARYAAGQAKPPKGALLFLPEAGASIGDDGVIAAALDEAPRAGWSVLAVQLPLLSPLSPASAYETTRDQAVARARQGLARLAADGAKAVIVVGRGASVELARTLAAEGGVARAVAALGPWRGDLGDSTLPLFDIALDGDARQAADARAALARREARAHYRQFVLVGADRRLLGCEQDIERRIRGWASQLPPPPPGG